MKVFVFTYDRYETISTSAMLEGENIDHVVLCHDDAARDAFIAAGHVEPHRLIATGNPRGLAYNRNAALDMMERDEWALFLVDDLKSVTEIVDYDERVGSRLGITLANQREFRGLMDQPITMAQFLTRAGEVAAVCESLDSRLGGFCGIANPLFRDAKWRFNVVADGRAWVVRRGPLRFDERVQMIDDVCWCAQNIERHGLVVVNQWVLPDCRRYTTGGFGSITQRLDQKLDEARCLVEAYPRTVRYATKAGWPAGSHVTLRRTLSPSELRALAGAVAGR